MSNQFQTPPTQTCNDDWHFDPENYLVQTFLSHNYTNFNSHFSQAETIMHSSTPDYFTVQIYGLLKDRVTWVLAVTLRDQVFNDQFKAQLDSGLKRTDTENDTLDMLIFNGAASSSNQGTNLVLIPAVLQTQVVDTSEFTLYFAIKSGNNTGKYKFTKASGTPLPLVAQ